MVLVGGASVSMETFGKLLENVATSKQRNESKRKMGMPVLYSVLMTIQVLSSFDRYSSSFAAGKGRRHGSGLWLR